jgi:small-conductance mechanosensitive channel
MPFGRPLVVVLVAVMAGVTASSAQVQVLPGVVPQPQAGSEPAAQGTPANEPAPDEEQSIDLNELPARLEESVQVVRRIARGLSPAIDEIAGELPDLAAGLRALIEQSRENVFSGRSAGLIASLRDLWRAAEAKLQRWQVELVAASTALDKDRSVLAEHSRYLTAAQDLLAAEGVEPDTLATIERVRAQVVAADGTAREQRNTLLGLQARLAELTIEIQLTEEELAEVAASERESMLRLDAPPIWRPDAPTAVEPETTATLAEQTVADAGTGALSRPQLAAVSYVFEYLSSLISQFIGVYLVFLLPFVLLRRRAALWRESERPSIRDLGRALERPWSAALLPAFIVSTIARGHVQVNSSLLLLPLLRVVPRLLPAKYKKSLWGLAGLVVVDSLAEFVLPQFSTFRRLVEVALIVLTAVGAVWLHRRLGADGRTTGLFGAARVGLRVSVAVLGVAAITEIVGATMLARYLETGILSTVYGAVLLYGFLLMFRGFLDLLIESRRGQLESIMQQAPVDLVGKLNAGMRWMTLVLFVLLVVETFQFTDPLVSTVGAFMAQSLTFGEIEFTVGSLAIFVAVVTVAVVLSSVLRFFLSAAVYSRFTLQRGTGEVISKLLHYGLLTAGILFALGAAGIDLNRFTILMGALGVGIGFGLQNIISNFVSGLILLFERPLNVGDIVSVNNVAGVVADIGIRATRIRTWDGADVAVPNSNLVSGEFTNWSLSDEKRRAEVKVGVAYGTDPERVCQLLKDVAQSHVLVMKDPEPVALFIGFGDSSLDFVLRFWTRLPDTLPVSSDLHTAVCRRLADEGIEIPFPQRDLHVRGVDPETVRLFEQRSAEGPKS